MRQQQHLMTPPTQSPRQKIDHALDPPVKPRRHRQIGVNGDGDTHFSIR
jgi:hypothetical protein